ncbi:MAG: multicopper oxidase domain-containing protein [Chloroflexota bacterium]
MSEKATDRRFTRRDLLRLGGQGALALLMGGAAGALVRPDRGLSGLLAGGEAAAAPQAAADSLGVYISLVATDGWVKTPDGKEHYGFGFADVTGVAESQWVEYRGKATLPSRTIVVNQGRHLYLTLGNVGLPQRPDLDDAHTVHFHGFPNATSIMDGVPQQTFSVPVGRTFTYYYNLREPGTYPYHCHFEDVEHIHMGMVGTIIVRPKQGAKYAYNDGSTQFNREYVLLLTEVDSKVRRLIASVQQPDWTDYYPDYWLLNGRTYPDTLKPNDDPSLPYQPVSSLIQANAVEKVLLRFNNLGFQQHAIQIPGIPFRVVGQDAKLLKNSWVDLSYSKNTLYLPPGETYDVILVAPPFSATSGTTARGPYTAYRLYSRNLERSTNSGAAGPGGMLTEIRVFKNRLPAQSLPNQWF